MTTQATGAGTAGANWPDRRILDLFGIDVPILLGPLAGNGTPEAAVAVSRAGGLGALACALLAPDDIRAAAARMKAADRPFNLNFFCHTPPAPQPQALLRWQALLAPYYLAEGIDPLALPPVGGRAPFDDVLCSIVEDVRPQVVSFHFGLPATALLDRVQATGAKVISSATSVAEARWLEARGCDAIIAMGLEAGGHRGHFLDPDISRQAGTFALVPQVVDAVQVPVIAAGGIADGRGIAAAFMLGASAVQIGTAFLFSPEMKVSAAHRAALEGADDFSTTLTTLFTGRPARGIVNRVMAELGPLNPEAPPFPLAGGALAPLKAKAEARGAGDFSNLWSGQAAKLAPRLPAGELVARLAADALARLAAVGGA